MNLPIDPYSELPNTPPPSDPLQRRILSQMGEAVGLAEEKVYGDDAFLGFFQSFRPDGHGLASVFDGLDASDALQERINLLFEVAGDDRRPTGGRDAYFVVRRPRRIDPDQIQAAGDDWVRRLILLASETQHDQLVKQLDGIKRVRLLEGSAPKNPRAEIDKTELLRAFQRSIPQLVSHPEAPSVAESLRTPYYYITCDSHLRDYLMWPLFAPYFQTEDPFAPYFDLWRHSVKFRIYRDDQIDLYMPRHD
ncbi:MAG: apolipoprotein acyltransferase [Planctomycetota bacterium]